MALLDPILRAAVWQRYEQDRPATGTDLQDWIARIAEESATPAARIRRIISEGSVMMLQALSTRQQTVAQQIAELMGASLTNAFAVLHEAYGATKKRLLLDGSGRPKLGEDGKVIWVEVEDWQSRLSAVRTTVEIFGARPPQQIEVESRSVVMNLSPEDALAELKRISTDLPRLQAAFAGIATAGDSGPAGAREVPQGAAGD